MSRPSVEQVARVMYESSHRGVGWVPWGQINTLPEWEYDRTRWYARAAQVLALFEPDSTRPPDGWFTFGSHAASPWVRVEFSDETDDGGMPLWERPVRETVTTAAELDALPVGSVVLDADEDAWQKRFYATGRDVWVCNDRNVGIDDEDDEHVTDYLPATVLHRPTEGDDLMNEYTPPTTNEVRVGYAVHVSTVNPTFEVPAVADDFDRWLAQHDREVAAKALRDAAEYIRDTVAEEGVDTAFNSAFERGGAPYVDRWLMERAYAVEEDHS